MDRIRDLEMKLSIDLLSLDMMMYNVNRSLQNELFNLEQNLSISFGRNFSEIEDQMESLKLELGSEDELILSRLDNISSLMVTMNELNALSSRLDYVMSDLNELKNFENELTDIKKMQKDTSSSLSLTIILLIIVLLLLAILIFLVSIHFNRGKKPYRANIEDFDPED